MLKYSNRSKKSYSLLLEYYNDIDVYVEDDTCRNMWVSIINSVLEGIARIQTVISLEGKHSVIDACEKDVDYSRPKIYIIDGDFDFIFKEPPKLDRLFRLNVYCVENLLFSKEAIIEVAFQSDINTPKIKIEEKICFNELVNELVNGFRELFIDYLIIQYLGESIKNTGINIYKFSLINKKCIKIIKKNIDNYINQNNTYLNKKYGSNNIIKIKQDVEKILNQKNIFFTGNFR